MTIKGSNFYAPVGTMGLGQIRAAWPVAAQPVKSAAYAANWLLGRGASLIVDGGHIWIPGSDGTQTRILRYKYHVDAVHTAIGIFIVASNSNTFVPVTINGTIYTVGTQATVIHYAIPNLSGDADLETNLTFEWPAGDVSDRNVLQIHNVQFYESPMIILPTSGAGPVEPGTLVYDGYDDRESISGLERAAEDLRATYFRRGALFNWASGYTDGFNTASTSYESIFIDSTNPAMQTRLMYEGETVRTVKCAIWVIGFGNVRLTMSNGDSVTFTVSEPYGEGAGVWMTDELDVETDDPSRFETDGGIRGGTRDALEVEYKADSGEQIFLFAVSIWDAPGD